MKTRRHVSLRKTKKGGRVLGRGASAYTIDPPIQCKDGRSMEGYVTRIPFNKNMKELASKDRKQVTKVLKKIDPDQKYFLYANYCTPGKLSEENKKDGVTDENKKYSEYIKKGTRDFYREYLPDYTTRTWKEFFKGKKKYVKKSNPEIPQELKDHIRKSVELLHKNKIVHLDLHYGNIIVGEDDLPRIIDFSESIYDPPDKVYEYDNQMLEELLNTSPFEESYSKKINFD